MGWKKKTGREWSTLIIILRNTPIVGGNEEGEVRKRASELAFQLARSFVPRRSGGDRKC